MKNFMCALLIAITSQVIGQTDTLKLAGPWNLLHFDTTELRQSRLLIGKPTSVTQPLMSIKSAKNANGEAFTQTCYYHRIWIDSLRTMFVFSSLTTDRQDSTVFTGMELYGRFPSTINGTIRIDLSRRSDVKKVFGEPDQNGAEFELTWQRYKLYVNNTWCQVDFYYDVNGTLRKVLIEKR